MFVEKAKNAQNTHATFLLTIGYKRNMPLLTEALSALSVSLVMIPEAIAFSLILGLPPAVGMVTSIVMAIAAGTLTGQPGLVSGSTASVAVAAAAAVKSHGTTALMPLVAMMACIQLLVGLFKGHRLLKFVPPHVVSGFLIALAYLIAQGQIQHFKEDGEDSEWMKGRQLALTVGVILFGVAVIWGSLALKVPIPPTIVSLIVVIAIVYLALPKQWNENLKKIRDFGDVALSWSSLKSVWTSTIANADLSPTMLLKLLPYAASMAITGLIESFLTLEEVSKMTGGGSSAGELGAKLHKETFAQGVANMLTALTGGQGGCVLVGQTMLNISNGAKTRWSSVMAGGLLLIMAIAAAPAISAIPMAGLVAAMVYIVYKTGDWVALRNVKWDSKYGIMLLTAISAILTHDLSVGVATGSVANLIVQKWT